MLPCFKMPWLHDRLPEHQRNSLAPHIMHVWGAQALVKVYRVLLYHLSGGIFLQVGPLGCNTICAAYHWQGLQHSPKMPDLPGTMYSG
jgi:hypothetical protein